MKNGTTLLPARFLATIGHLIATLMVYQTKEGNITASLPLNDFSLYGVFNSSYVLSTILSK
ncbi:hypothetical protein HK098_006691 [Nowakowskiella sp. JEL0407]|nr:hypothetical protein HK098_006691 [Nowakowskiella sp. JEL0407]